MGNEQQYPPGWYPDARDQRRLRRWDGMRWTDETRPISGPPPAAGDAGAKKPKGGARRIVGIAIGLVLFVGVCSNLFADDTPEIAAPAEQSEAGVQDAGSEERDSAPAIADPTEASEPTPADPESTPAPSPTPVEEPLPGGIPADAQAATVERVVDGDTIWVRVDEPGGPLPADASHNVRLLVIDTPETQHPSKGLECWGPEATDYTTRQLDGEEVYLVADVEDTDRYGRFLRHVFTDDGEHFNVQVTRRGFARASLYEPNDRFYGRVQRAERRAKDADRGMWGGPCDYDAPPPEPEPEPQPVPEPEPAPEPETGGGCEPGYEPCVPVYPPDVDCANVSGPISVTGSDPHGLDADGDGVGCES